MKTKKRSPAGRKRPAAKRRSAPAPRPPAPPARPAGTPGKTQTPAQTVESGTSQILGEPSDYVIP